MIRIRTGTSWRDDPRVAAALRPASAGAASRAAREIIDALAIEVDGVDIAFGRAEAPLLPSLEELLLSVAHVLSGAPQATVMLGDGDLELFIRRRGGSAFLTVVALGRPSRILAGDVEVEVEALAAAALEAAAGFCRELATALPGGERHARTLEAAARRLSRTRPRPPASATPQPTIGNRDPAAGRIGCAIEIADREGLLAAYPGGRPDLGSLLAPGSVVLRAADGAALLSIPGPPYLVLRDLTAAADRALCAARRGDPRIEIPLARPGRAVSMLVLELASDDATLDGRPVACPALELLRAFAEAAVEFCRLAVARNPRQAENGHVAELESAATARLAEIWELAGGDAPRAGPVDVPARAPAVARVDRRPLGPGRLRRLSFQRVGSAEVGAPTALVLRGGRVIAAGRGGTVCLERDRGTLVWRGRGAALQALFPGIVLASSGERVWALWPRTGRRRWERDLPGATLAGAALLSGGPLALIEPGAVTGVDPESGRTAWRFTTPGASRTWAAAFGGVLVAGSDAGFLYGLDAGGRLLWRIRAPGPLLRGPTPWVGTCLALCEAAPGSVLLAVDAASGVRRFEAPLDLVPSGPPHAWGQRLVLGGTVGGDPVITALRRSGDPAWTTAPPLAGAPEVLPAGRLLVVRDVSGGLVALGRDGRPVWARPAPEAAWRGPRPLGLARDTLAVAGEGIACHALANGEILGALPGVSAAHLAVDGELTVAALDLDGLLTVHRLRTHLSVV